MLQTRSREPDTLDKSRSTIGGRVADETVDDIMPVDAVIGRIPKPQLAKRPGRVSTFSHSADSCAPTARLLLTTCFDARNATSQMPSQAIQV